MASGRRTRLIDSIATDVCLYSNYTIEGLNSNRFLGGGACPAPIGVLYISYSLFTRNKLHVCARESHVGLIIGLDRLRLRRKSFKCLGLRSRSSMFLVKG
jgi:hypothetical protein